MKHMACEKIALLGVFAIAGCYSYASEAINNGTYNTIVAAPNFVNIKSGDSDQVIVRLTNANGNGAITGYTVSAVGAGIRVDSSCTVPNLTSAQQTAASCNGYYRPVFNSGLDTLVPSGPSNQAQFYVVGLATGQYAFTVTPKSVNTGVSTTVTVVVQAITLGPALSKTTAVAGDTVVITAPAGTVFSQTSAVTFATGAAPIVARSADSTTITLIVGGGITGPATVTKVGTKANPAVPPVTLVTSSTLTTPALFAGTLSATTPAAGATVTITAPNNQVFSQTSAVTFTKGPAPIITARAADSTSISFLVGPGDSGVATVTKVGIKNAPILGVQTLTTSNSLNVPAILVAPTTVSTVTPAFGAPVTVTLGGGLRFLSNSTISIGSNVAFILSMSADSTSAVIVPNVVPQGGGFSGLVSYTNIALTVLTVLPVSVNGDKTITVGPLTSDPNATALATASIFTLAPSGQASALSDSGPFNNPSQCGGISGDGCRLYKVVLAGSTTFDLHLIWQGGADMGLYILDSGGAFSTGGAADAGGQGPSGQPENATVTLAAGTYYFAVEFFGTGSGYPSSANTVPPTFYQLLVTTH
jgi:hypothetical protein